MGKHMDDLERRFNGPIPKHLLEQARYLDRAELIERTGKEIEDAAKVKEESK